MEIGVILRLFRQRATFRKTVGVVRVAAYDPEAVGTTMPVNVFDLIDSAFRGFILLLYSFVSSIWLSLIRPFRAPTILLRAYRDPKMRQLSAPTLLVLLYLLFLGMVPGLTGLSDGGEFFVSTSTAVLKEGHAPDLALLFVVGAFVAATTLDATVRLLVKLICRGPYHRRGLRVAVIDYAFILPLAFAGGGGQSLFLATARMHIPAEEQSMITGFSFLALLTLLSIPAAHRLARLVGRRRRARWILTGAFTLPCALYLIACLALAGSLVGFLKERRDLLTAPDVEILDLRCRVGPQPRVEILIANQSAKVLLVDMALWRLEATGHSGRLLSGFVLPGALDVTARVIKPGGTISIIVPTIMQPTREWLLADTCRLIRPRTPPIEGPVVPEPTAILP